MPVTAGGDPSFPAPRPRKPKKSTAPRKGRAAHSAKPKTPAPGTFHETAGAGGQQPSAALGHNGHPSGGALAALDLVDLGGGAVAGTGLGEVLLDLVGEGQLRLGSALAAWQREQERVSNRAWRRPGGMARMGGL